MRRTATKKQITIGIVVDAPLKRRVVEASGKVERKVAEFCRIAVRKAVEEVEQEQHSVAQPSS